MLEKNLRHGRMNRAILLRARQNVQNLGNSYLFVAHEKSLSPPLQSKRIPQMENILN